MSKLQAKKPTLIMLYGYPGAGKTYFSRQLSEEFAAAHVHDDKIRHAVFDTPRYDKQENQILMQLMLYMTEEFLKAGVSVIFDTNAMRKAQRQRLRELARHFKAERVLVWLQVDPQTAFVRASRRDRRKSDDRYAVEMTEPVFERIAGYMQNPMATEDYVVLSGKHTYKTQANMFLKRLYDQGLIDAQKAAAKMVRPELMNRIPNPLAGRVDNSRRNINIR